MAKVSIIVPIYNVEKYLDRCVQSLINQTLRDIEIILVDDESPDKCPQMCDEYAKQDSRIKVIHKKNGGLGYARNSGLELAMGDYVTFCDSDDWVDLNTYEYVFNLCIEKNLDMCCFQHRTVDQKDNCKNIQYVSDSEYFLGKERINEYLLGVIGKDYNNPNSKTYGMSSCMTLFKRSTFVDSGIRYPSERDVASEDFVFLLYYLTYVNSILVIPNVFYNYYINSNSISHTFVYSKFFLMENTMSILKSECDKIFPWDRYKNHYYTQMLRFCKMKLKSISKSNISLHRKLFLVNNESNNEMLSPLYKDKVRFKYGFIDFCIILCLKYRLSFIIILFYSFKKN